MITIKEYRANFIARLSAVTDPMEAETIFHMVLEAFTGMKRVAIALNPQQQFTSDEVQKWDRVLEQLLQEVPVQYILGQTSFFGLEFAVNEHVLIPRPETEELVSWIVADNEFAGPLRILDIGTGSGCIAVSLAKNLPDAAVAAIDVSEAALAVAKKNAAANDVEVRLIEKDILSAMNLGSYEVIVSNPPYVRELEKVEIKKNVQEYEPHLALFVADDDPLLFYRKIAGLALESLVPGGKLYFEINQYLGAEMIDLLQQKGFADIELRKDIYGNDRMLNATKR